MPTLIPHRHCIVCGKAIEPEKSFCGDKCEKKYKDERKRQRNFTIFMFLLLIALIVMIFLTTPK